MAQQGFRNGLRKNAKGTYDYKIRVGARIKGGTFQTTRLETAKLLRDQKRDDLLREQEGLALDWTLNDVLDYWVSTRQAAAMHKERAGFAFTRIRPILGENQVRRLTPADMMRAAKILQEPDNSEIEALSPASVNLVLRYVGIAINWAHKNRKIAEHPLREMPYVTVKKRARPYLTFEEVVFFLQQVDKIGTLHQRIAIRAQLLMGLRESESLRLRWDGFFGDGEFYIPSWTKNGEAQAIPVAKELQRMLRDLPHKSEWVLPGRAGSLHRKGYTRSIVEQAGTAIGKVHLTPHRLRASCATILAANGGGAHQVKDLLRHANISTSQAYVEQFPQSIRTLANKAFDSVAEEFGPVPPSAPSSCTPSQTTAVRPMFTFASALVTAS